MSVNIHQERKNVQNGMVDYFGDIILTKCREIPSSSPSSPSYSIYYARIGCLLCIDDRYIVVVVENSFPYFDIGYQTRLSSLDWTSFQTRTVQKPPRELKTQISKSGETKIISSKINLVEKRDDRYVYFCDNIPLKIELLFTKNDESYSEFGTIQSALETYNCVVSFLL
jgi:hypothetical protein